MAAASSSSSRRAASSGVGSGEWRDNDVSAGTQSSSSSSPASSASSASVAIRQPRLAPAPLSPHHSSNSASASSGTVGDSPSSADTHSSQVQHQPRAAVIMTPPHAQAAPTAAGGGQRDSSNGAVATASTAELQARIMALEAALSSLTLLSPGSTTRSVTSSVSGAAPTGDAFGAESVSSWGAGSATLPSAAGMRAQTPSPLPYTRLASTGSGTGGGGNRGPLPPPPPPPPPVQGDVPRSLSGDSARFLSIGGSMYPPSSPDAGGGRGNGRATARQLSDLVDMAAAPRRGTPETVFAAIHQQESPFVAAETPLKGRLGSDTGMHMAAPLLPPSAAAAAAGGGGAGAGAGVGGSDITVRRTLEWVRPTTPTSATRAAQSTAATAAAAALGESQGVRRGVSTAGVAAGVGRARYLKRCASGGHSFRRSSQVPEQGTPPKGGPTQSSLRRRRRPRLGSAAAASGGSGTLRVGSRAHHHSNGGARTSRKPTSRRSSVSPAPNAHDAAGNATVSGGRERELERVQQERERGMGKGKDSGVSAEDKVASPASSPREEQSMSPWTFLKGELGWGVVG